MNSPRWSSLKQLPQWQIYLLTVAVTVGITAGVWALTIRPLQLGSEQNAAQREQFSERQQQAARISADLLAVGKQLKDEQSALERSAVRLQTIDKLNQRLVALATLASDSNLRIDEIQPGATAENKHYRTLGLRISAGGRYGDCTRFLRRLHQQFPDMAVESIECTSADAVSAITIRLDLQWFILPM